MTFKRNLAGQFQVYTSERLSTHLKLRGSQGDGRDGPGEFSDKAALIEFDAAGDRIQL